MANKADCRERANANMELAKFEFRQPPLLTDEEVEEILGRIEELIAWASDIKDYALQAAISGKQWSGYKLVEGRSNRKYTDENAVIAAVTAAGYDPYEHKILGVTAMTSLLGKKQFNDILAEITEIRNVKDSEGFSSKRETVLAFIRVYREGRHGSERWANLAAFSEATDLFRFRTIPDLKITTEHFILCNDERFNIISVEDIKGRGMYTEILAKKVVATSG